MILVLMLTYLWGLNEELPGQKATWWLHALLILAFPPLILRSKHFHILMAPINIFFRAFTLGEYLPLDLDIDELADSEEEISFGLESMADVPWKMRMDFLTCVECKRCTEQCPAASCDQELDPRGFILDGRAMLGQEAAVVGPVISEIALGQCTSCGACESICPVGIEHLEVLIGAKRAQALSTGKGMVATEYLQSIERYGNPFAAPKDARKKLIEELGIPLFEKGETEHLLWLGCVWTYNEDARGSLEAMVTILTACWRASRAAAIIHAVRVRSSSFRLSPVRTSNASSSMGSKRSWPPVPTVFIPSAASTPLSRTTSRSRQSTIPSSWPT
jgi:heterodisulfide reductase subunit C